MSDFTGGLTLTHLDKDWRLWELETPLTYEVGYLGSGRRVEVPAGFITDGASVPRIFWPLFPTWGKYSRAAVIHDYLGDLLVNRRAPHPEGLTQRQIDGVFYEAMKVCDVVWPVRLIIFAIVRLTAIVRRLP
jgi:hypothetical protein